VLEALHSDREVRSDRFLDATVTGQVSPRPRKRWCWTARPYPSGPRVPPHAMVLGNRRTRVLPRWVTLPHRKGPVSDRPLRANVALRQHELLLAACAPPRVWARLVPLRFHASELLVGRGSAWRPG
jgi:hypothetical protein